MAAVINKITGLHLGTSRPKYAALPREEIDLREAGEIDRSALQAKAKTYGIKANLPSMTLIASIKLYEAGRASEIPKEHIKKGKEANFLMAHKKVAGVSGGCLLLILVILIVLFSRPPTDP